MRPIAYAYLLYLLTPIVLLMVGAVGDEWSGTLLPEGLTWRWFEQVWQDPSYRSALFTTLKIALATCVINILVVVPLVYAITIHLPVAARRIAAMAALLPIAVPQLVIGFAFILAFSSALMPWLGSLWLLIAGHIVITLSYLFYSISAEIEHSPLPRYELMARSFGASSRQRFCHLYLPMARRSILTGTMTVAALSIGEFELSNLIAGFMSRPYPVVLLQAFYRATGFASAATVLLLSLALLFALISSLLQWRSQSGRGAIA